jgi:hypothetical protein
MKVPLDAVVLNVSVDDISAMLGKVAFDYDKEEPLPIGQIRLALFTGSNRFLQKKAARSHCRLLANAPTYINGLEGMIFPLCRSQKFIETTRFRVTDFDAIPKPGQRITDLSGTWRKAFATGTVYQCSFSACKHASAGPMLCVKCKKTGYCGVYCERHDGARHGKFCGKIEDRAYPGGLGVPGDKNDVDWVTTRFAALGNSA